MVVVMSDRFVGHLLDESEPGTGVIWLDNVVCGDSCVADLSQCSYEGWGFSRCGHETDVSIACHDDTPDSGKPHYTMCRNFHGLFCLCVCVCVCVCLQSAVLGDPLVWYHERSVWKKHV